MSVPTINVVEPGGTAATLVRLAAGRSHPARVHHGRPVTMGPAVCQGCGSRVWWSGGLWSDASGTWHRLRGVSLGRRKRFAILERDDFTCQYPEATA